MCEKKFDVKKLEKLNKPQRLIDIPVQDLAQKLNLKSTESYAEIGAGTAFFSVAFFKQYKPKTLFACDISSTMLSWIEENITPEYPAITPVLCQESLIPLSEESVDFVFMISLHHELEQPEQTLTESFRILKPGGKILIVDWKQEDMAEGPPAKIRCSTSEVQTQIEDAGFTCSHISNDLKNHFYIIAQK